MIQFNVGDTIMSNENWHLSGKVTAITPVFVQYKSFIGGHIRNIHVSNLGHYRKINNV